MNSLKKNVIKDSFGWDVVNWSRSIPFWEKHLGDIKGKTALELGNGGKFGGLSLWLAYKGANVICSDYKGVSDEAKAIHAKYDFGKNIKYEIIDAMKIPYDNHFDIIACKSMLGGIVRDKDISIGASVVNSIRYALANEGTVLFCENAKSTILHQFLRNKYGAGKNNWKYFENTELMNLFSLFNKVALKSVGFLGCFGKTEKQKFLLGQFDTLLSFLPDSCKYITLVTANK